MNSITQNLLDQVESYCRLSGIPETKFGILAVKDPNFVRQVRDGRDLRLSTIQRIEDFMRANPPSQQPHSEGS